jgi:hypothetical protein
MAPTPPGSLGVACCALLAAASGVAAAHLDPAPAPVAFALTPDQLTEWTKAICNNIFTVVNTLIGLYNLLAIGRSTVGRRRAGKRTGPTPPVDPAPHTDAPGGA